MSNGPADDDLTAAERRAISRRRRPAWADEDDDTTELEALAGPVEDVNGPSGRRASLVGGPDVWEVIRALQDTTAAEPALGERQVWDVVIANTGVTEQQLRDATAWYATHPDEVDADIALARSYDAFYGGQPAPASGVAEALHVTD